ncbi:hypothetical protein AKO1_000116, partial [Acrasis kona]
MHKIRSADISDNVVEMMTARIHKFSSDTQQVLSLAASIGSRFDYHLLSQVYGDDIKCRQVLWPAIKDGLVHQLGGSISLDDIWLNQHDIMIHQIGESHTLQFLHDKVHQAAYELVEPLERYQVHLNIG